MSDTPRTDAAEQRVKVLYKDGWQSKAEVSVVPADFARQLERELGGRVTVKDTPEAMAMVKDAERYRRLKKFALPRYAIHTTSGVTASLFREHDITVDLFTWEAFDQMLDQESQGESCK